MSARPRGFVVWLTGLPGAGKTTLAVALAAVVRGRGVHPEILDGDDVRRDLCAGLGFSREDRDTNVRRIGFVAAAVARCGGAAIVAAVSPFRATRDEQRRRVESFVEIYCHADLQALVARDPKGLYRRALAGEIAHFTGIDDPYEPPLAPEVTCETAIEPVEDSLAAIVRALDVRGLLG